MHRDNPRRLRNPRLIQSPDGWAKEVDSANDTSGGIGGSCSICIYIGYHGGSGARRIFGRHWTRRRSDQLSARFGVGIGFLVR